MGFSFSLNKPLLIIKSENISHISNKHPPGSYKLIDVKYSTWWIFVFIFKLNPSLQY